MEIIICLVIIIILFLILFYKVSKIKIVNNNYIPNTETIKIINDLANKTIDTSMRLYGDRNDIDEFIRFTLKEIQNRISNSEISQYDKDYWNYEQIENYFKAIIVKTFRKTL